MCGNPAPLKIFSHCLITELEQYVLPVMGGNIYRDSVAWRSCAKKSTVCCDIKILRIGFSVG